MRTITNSISLLLPALLVALSAGHAVAVTYTTLDHPLATNSTIATGISGNNVVGFYQDYDATSNPDHWLHGFLYDGSSYTTLNAPLAALGTGTIAWGISGSNIVGWYEGHNSAGNSGEYGFIYNGSTYSTLQHPLGVRGTRAFGISGSNIVGNYYDSSFTGHGFLYNGSSYTTIDDPLGVGGTFPYGISGNDIVGFYYDSSGHQHGFLYDGSSYTTLDFPGAIDTTAAGIFGNNIIGHYSEFNGDRGHNYLFNGSTYTILEDPFGMQPSNTFGIDGNNIVGFYNDSSSIQHGFLAQVPEPSSILLFSIGAIGLGAVARRRRRTRN